MNKRILTEIWIYPVKALGGIRLAQSPVQEKGLTFDRRWMLVDENNIFMTQRDFPQLALFSLSMGTGEFVITKGEDSISLHFVRKTIGLVINSVVWDDEVQTEVVSEVHNKWFSDRVGVSCKLVSFPEENIRQVDPNFALGKENVSLADGFPLLIIGQSSLDALNARMKDPLPMNRFRPNLVFTGGEAHEEDAWKTFSVGSNRFVGVKPCARCTVPTVNQSTGEKGIEPLLTLSKYRKSNGKVFFGQNVIPIDNFEIHEGDEISLL